MTTQRSPRLAALLLPLLLLATACDSGTGALHQTEPPEVVPEAFTIHSTEVAVSETCLEGTFEAFGVLADRGTVRDVLNAPAPLSQWESIHGVKTLEGANGTIEIEFFAKLRRVDQSPLSARI